MWVRSAVCSKSHNFPFFADKWIESAERAQASVEHAETFCLDPFVGRPARPRINFVQPSIFKAEEGDGTVFSVTIYNGNRAFTERACERSVCSVCQMVIKATNRYNPWDVGRGPEIQTGQTHAIAQTCRQPQRMWQRPIELVHPITTRTYRRPTLGQQRGIERRQESSAPGHRHYDFSCVRDIFLQESGRAHEIVRWTIERSFALQHAFGALNKQRTSVGGDKRDRRVVQGGGKADIDTVCSVLRSGCLSYEVGMLSFHRSRCDA